MKLSMKNRIVLLNILPPEADALTMKIVRRLKEDLAPSEQDWKKYKMITEGDRTRWDDSIDRKFGGKEIKMWPKAFVMIQEALEALNKQKKITEEILEMYELFCEEGEEAPIEEEKKEEKKKKKVN